MIALLTNIIHHWEWEECEVPHNFGQLNWALNNSYNTLIDQSLHTHVSIIKVALQWTKQTDKLC